MSKTLRGWRPSKRFPAYILKVVAFASLTLPVCAHAQISLERFQEYVDKVCKEAPLESRNSKAELNANAKIELNDLLKKLAGGGASISGSRAQEETYGIKQEQLASSIKDGNDCRMAMYRLFKDKIDFRGTESNLRIEEAPRNAPPGQQAAPSKNKSAQQTGLPDKIAEVGLAVGDSIDKVNTSGLQGQFGTTPDNRTIFRTPITIPVQSMDGSRSYVQGMAAFIFDKSIIRAISLFFMEPSDCSEAKAPGGIMSSSIRDLGEPLGSPETKTSQEMIDGLPYIVENREYEFARNGEFRGVIVSNATGMNMAILKRCIVLVVREQQKR